MTIMKSVKLLILARWFNAKTHFIIYLIHCNNFFFLSDSSLCYFVSTPNNAVTSQVLCHVQVGVYGKWSLIINHFGRGHSRQIVVAHSVTCPENMNSMKPVIPLHYVSWVNSFWDICRKCIWPNTIRANHI